MSLGSMSARSNEEGQTLLSKLKVHYKLNVESQGESQFRNLTPTSTNE